MQGNDATARKRTPKGEKERAQYAKNKGKNKYTASFDIRIPPIFERSPPKATQPGFRMEEREPINAES
jgi:hypothetical protein